MRWCLNLDTIAVAAVGNNFLSINT
jgi:hypothetical protein